MQEKEDQIQKANMLIKVMKEETEKIKKISQSKGNSSEQQKVVEELRKQVKDIMKQAVEGRQKLVKEHEQRIVEFQKEI